MEMENFIIRIGNFTFVCASGIMRLLPWCLICLIKSIQLCHFVGLRFSKAFELCAEGNTMYRIYSLSNLTLNQTCFHAVTLVLFVTLCREWLSSREVVAKGKFNSQDLDLLDEWENRR